MRAVPAAPPLPPSDVTGVPTIDDYRSGDDRAVVTCLHEGFGAPIRYERWRRLHLENPVGASVLVVTRHEATIVGEIANLRRRLPFFGAEHSSR